MSCYILAGGKNSQQQDFTSVGELTRLERGYRRYAAIFEKVKLVIKTEQAREHYLNYPHVCDRSDLHHFSVGVRTALQDNSDEALFIGSSEIFDFPLQLPVHLIQNYNGEPFLGYDTGSNDEDCLPFLFGIYGKGVLSQLEAAPQEDHRRICQKLYPGSRLLPLPDGTEGCFTPENQTAFR